MDVDFFATRVHSAKHFSSLQAARLNHNLDNHLNKDGSEGDDDDDDDDVDDARAYFPCPFCYIEIELQILCSHLQEEHCFDLKNAVCPLCAANLGKDATGHFTMHHSNSIKRRRKSKKSGLWSNSSTKLGKDFRKLNLFLGSSSMSGRGNVDDSVPDPLLSPFLFNVPLPDPNGSQEEDGCSTASSTGSDMTSTAPTRSDIIQEQDYEESRQRAAFFQELIVSTIF